MTADGFGEAFRRLSWDDVGPRAILSRALAGTVGIRLWSRCRKPASPWAGCRAHPGPGAPACGGDRRWTRPSPIGAAAMIAFDEARARILAGVARLGRERVHLGEAAGRVLAESVTATRPFPPVDLSAMDGYAVRTDDFSGTAPFRFPVAPRRAARANRRRGCQRARSAESSRAQVCQAGPTRWSCRKR